jgi:hypothetical protein
MKKVKEMFLLFPEIKEITFSDSGESIKCITNNGATIYCTTFKELKRELKKP